MKDAMLLVASDVDGHLSDDVKRDAQRVGHWLARQGRAPRRVRCATTRRARELADKCVKAAGGTAESVIVDPDLDEPAAAALDDDASVLLVAPSASVVALAQEFDAGLAGASFDEAATLVLIGDQGAEVIRPSTLPRTFTVDGPEGPVERERPPYYYTQSGALPFRWREGQIEILLVSKPGRDRWSIPKGIVEPGLSSPASAAKETLEEAGAIGRVDSVTLGHYVVEKWGGHCEVAVHPLEVSELVPESGWEESHKRERRWFHAADAQDVVRVPALVPMIDGLLARYMKVLE